MKNNYWLKENIRSVIAFMWTLCGICIFIIILFKDVKTDDKTTFMIINSMLGIMGFILGYYFGASKTQSENTTDAIEKMTGGPIPPLEPINVIVEPVIDPIEKDGKP